MPLWCCGRNCGRNSRVAVLILSLIGISCSTWVCLSHQYFHFESLRNDTFFDLEKAQPEPFEYATSANVGLFKYQILEVFEFPWPPIDEYPWPPTVKPPTRRERRRAEEMMLNEIRRLQETDSPAPDANATEVPTTETAPPISANFTSNSTAPSIAPSTVPSTAPSTAPSTSPSSAPSDVHSAAPTEVHSAVPSAVPSAAPTSLPTAKPTITNPNDIVAATVDLGVVKSYEEGMNQFGSLFQKGQLGALVAPILAGIGTVFGLIEFCCCTYKCSWLPTALFLYLAHMMQMATVFLFLSEDFCKYEQDCSLGFAGYLSAVAILCYLIGNMLVCCTPRPSPCFNFCKKAPVRRKKKKKKKRRGFDGSEREGLNSSRSFSDNPGEQFDDEDDFDDDAAYADPYGDEDDDDFDDDGYGDGYDDEYQDYDNDTYANDTFAGDANGSYYDNDNAYDDGESAYTGYSDKFGADERYT